MVRFEGCKWARGLKVRQCVNRNKISLSIWDVRRKKVLLFDRYEHQGGVDAALLKTVWF
jgi:hypothetical protein